ncbi:aspartic peptidase domain-containing protein [Chytridium lagenaria]|nr:aspartic peptidase domain-containing protein [Chytridium lagenaria]
MQPHTILALFTLLINHSIPSKCLQIPVHHPALGETLSVERLTLNKSLAPDQAKLLPMQQKKLVGLKGNPTMTGCWLGKSRLDLKRYCLVNFLSLIDSGSSDLLIPAVGLNDYTGPGYNTEGKTRLSSTVFRGRFADNSSWVGQYYSDTVTIGGGVATSPFAVMTEQSTEVLVVDGQKSQGLIGIGFDPLSIWQQTTPKTLLSSLLSSRAITRDAVAFRGCPASSSLSSLMDLGIEDLPSLSCPNSVIHWANVPEALITLTTLILPGFVFQRVYDAIMQSGLLQQILSARQLELMMSMNFGYNIADTFPYDRLPVIQVTLESKTPGQKLTLSLTGRTYFQADNEGFVFFMARNGGTQYTNIILGAVVFDTFMIVLDRENRRVGFAPGCECRNVANGIRVSTEEQWLLHPVLSRRLFHPPTRVTPLPPSLPG